MTSLCNRVCHHNFIGKNMRLRISGTNEPGFPKQVNGFQAYVHNSSYPIPGVSLLQKKIVNNSLSDMYSTGYSFIPSSLSKLIIVLLRQLYLLYLGGGDHQNSATLIMCVKEENHHNV